MGGKVNQLNAITISAAKRMAKDSALSGIIIMGFTDTGQFKLSSWGRNPNWCQKLEKWVEKFANLVEAV